MQMPLLNVGHLNSQRPMYSRYGIRRIACARCFLPQFAAEKFPCLDTLSMVSVTTKREGIFEALYLGWACAACRSSWTPGRQKSYHLLDVAKRPLWVVTNCHKIQIFFTTLWLCLEYRWRLTQLWDSMMQRLKRWQQRESGIQPSSDRRRPHRCAGSSTS